MVAGVKAALRVSITGKQISTNDIGTPGMPFDIEAVLDFVPGTDATNKADRLFLDKRTLASAGTENLDLAGSLVDAFGQTITDAEVVAIFLRADPANTTDLTFFGAASNAFNANLSGTTPKITLRPGDFTMLSSKSGWAVTAGTGDIILAANASGAAASYDVAIIGRSVAA